MGNDMAIYDGFFDALGLRDWCDANKEEAPMSMAQLLTQSGGGDGGSEAFPFPSLDVLHESCGRIGQTRDLTAGIEDGFLAIRGGLKSVLDPITQPLSWLLDSTLYVFDILPWWILIPLLVILTW
jgi:glycine betaine/proline transport system permease protein